MRRRSKLIKLTEDNFWAEFHRVHGGNISTNVGTIKVTTEEDKD